MPFELAFSIIVLILSIVIHEVAHGYAAERLGDPTARLEGRLTLNPLKHIDPLGSIIIPGILLLSNAQILFGWAKPVPYNPYNLRPGRFSEAFVAGAGPVVNLAIAILFSLFIRFGLEMGAPSEFIKLASTVVYINILLAFFNLVPMPPLDGAKVLRSLFPSFLSRIFLQFETLMASLGGVGIFIFVFLFFYTLWPFFADFLSYVFVFLTGVTLY